MLAALLVLMASSASLAQAQQPSALQSAREAIEPTNTPPQNSSIARRSHRLHHPPEC